MNRDLLDQAAESLRSSAKGPGLSPEQGLDRVLRDVRVHKRRRRMTILAALQVLVLLVGFGAWAAGTGRLTAFIENMRAHKVLSPPEKPGESKPGSLPSSVEPAGNPATEPAGEPSIESPATEPETLGETQQVHPEAAKPVPSRPRHLTSRRATKPAVFVPPQAIASVETPTELYKRAHEAHFVQKDWALAAQLWEAYLKSDEATFAVEARFNRALALARLGRKRDALEALRPFAQGEYGGYRRNEAERLVQWLESSAP